MQTPARTTFAPPGNKTAYVVRFRSGHSGLGSLIWTLVRTDFKSRYHGTLGGFLWALMKPLMMFVVLVSVFSFLFRSDPSYKVNLVIGLFLYDFFAEATKAGLQSLHSKGFLLSKAKFPTWVLVVTSVSNSVITLAILSIAATLFILVSHGTLAAVALPFLGLYLLCYLLIVVGFSLATSVLYLRYRDLNQVWEVVVQAGLFIAPVLYPLNIIPERFHFFLYLWPPTPVIQFSRAALVEGTIPSLKAHAFLGLEAALVLAAGVLIFRRLAPRAAEYL
jgi:ABC-type polysaccharide/polyol phosphate export permease